MEDYLIKARSLSAAVGEACAGAGKEQKEQNPWLAWALAIEGDWR